MNVTLQINPQNNQNLLRIYAAGYLYIFLNTEFVAR